MKGSAKAQSNRICGLISSLFSKNCTHGPLNNPYFVLLLNMNMYSLSG